MSLMIRMINKLSMSISHLTKCNFITKNRHYKLLVYTHQTALLIGFVGIVTFVRFVGKAEERL